MTLFDWLGTATGIELTHALIVLIVAISGWISYRNHVRIGDVSDQLVDHVKQVDDRR